MKLFDENATGAETSLVTAGKILRELFGFDDFLPFQDKAIDAILQGEDLLAVLPTGSGKSLCFQIPSLMHEGITIVISPLIALMKDQIDGLLARNLPVASLHSALTVSERERILDDIRAGLVKMVYVSPERLRDSFFLNALLSQYRAPHLWIVDEAHCITEWGHDFRTDYLYIPEAIKLLSNDSQLAMFTATATPIVREDIIRQMGRESVRTICGNFDRPNLYLGCRQATSKNDKLRTLVELLRKPGPGIIYAATRRQCEDINRFLQELGKASDYYHAGRSSSERERVHERFLSNDIEVIAATNAFGMGVDKPDLRFIIHYAHPASIDAYYQEIGRGGRDGKRCDCILLFSPYDRKVQEQFIKNSTPDSSIVEECFRDVVRAGNRSGDLLLKRASYDDYTVELFEMEKAGVLKRNAIMCGKASLYLSHEFERALELCSPLQRKVLSALDNQLNLAGKGYASDIDLEILGRKCLPDMGTFTLEQTLLHMSNRGIIAYRLVDRRIRYEVHPQGISERERSIIEESVSSRRIFKTKRLQMMIRYGKLKTCLRKFLLDALADTFPGDGCGFCDNCL